MMLFEALCLNVRCGHRLALKQRNPLIPDDVWECSMCGAKGKETTEHIQFCQATDALRASSIRQIEMELVPKRPRGQATRAQAPHIQAVMANARAGAVASTIVANCEHFLQTQSMTDAVQKVVAAAEAHANYDGPDRALVTKLRITLSLTGLLGGTAISKDVGFAEWSSWYACDQALGADGTGWALPWRGRFLCVIVTKAMC